MSVRISASTSGANPFDASHLAVDITKRARAGRNIALTAQGIKFALRIGSTAVLARLLTPADFGLVAMASVITGFVEMFKDAGLSAATIQRNVITEAQVTNLFWINAGFGLAAFSIILALSPVIAWFYADQRLMWITGLTAVSSVLGGFTVQHQALLRRTMRFERLAFIEILAAIIGVAMAVSLVKAGFGYWALVWMTIGSAAATLVMTLLLSGWWPTRPILSANIRPLLNFGRDIVAFNMMNYFSRNADNFLIGWRWGAAELALYSRAYGLLMLPLSQVLQPIGSVNIPAMSRAQNNPVLIRSTYRGIVRQAMTIICVPVSVLIVFSEEIVLLILGPQWVEAATIFRWLSILAITQPMLATCSWVMQAQGRSKELLLWGLIGSTISVISFIAGLPWGALGVAKAYMLTSLLLKTPLLLWWVGRKGAVRWTDTVFPAIPALAVCGIGSAAAFAVQHLFLTTTSIRETMIVCSALVLGQGVLLWAGRKSRWIS